MILCTILYLPMFTVHPNYKFKAKALGLNEKLPDRPMDAWNGQMNRRLTDGVIPNGWKEGQMEA